MKMFDAENDLIRRSVSFNAVIGGIAGLVTGVAAGAMLGKEAIYLTPATLLAASLHSIYDKKNLDAGLGAISAVGAGYMAGIYIRDYLVR